MKVDIVIAYRKVGNKRIWVQVPLRYQVVNIGQETGDDLGDLRLTGEN